MDGISIKQDVWVKINV